MPGKTATGKMNKTNQKRTRPITQSQRIRDLMADGVWRTHAEISALTGDRPKSVAVRLRELRSPKFGRHKVKPRQRPGGTYEYKLTLSDSTNS